MPLQHNTARRVLLFLILAGLLIWPVMGQTTLEDKYTQELDKLKSTSDYLYRDGSILQYSIKDFNPDFEYYITIYGPHHAYKIKRIQLKDREGSIPFTFPGLSYVHINLQRIMPADDKTRDILCEKYQYISSYGQLSCDIVKNLDMITVGSSSKINPPDIYIYAVRKWTRAETDKINGASWNALINAEKTTGKT